MNLCPWVNDQVFFQLNSETNFFLASGNQLKEWASWYIFNLAYQHLSLIHRFPLSPALPLVCASPTVSDSSYWIGAFLSHEFFGGGGAGRRVHGYIRLFPEGVLLQSLPSLTPEHQMTLAFKKRWHSSHWEWHYEQYTAELRAELIYV